MTAVATEPASKYEAIVAGARDLFLREGFEGTSVDAIAAAACVSKRTVYRYFDSKEQLFAAVVERLRNSTFDNAFDRASAADPREALRAFARRFLAFVFHPESLAFHRMVIAESTRFPAIARDFHAAGPERTMRALAEFLQRHCNDPRLRVADPERDAEEFLETLRGSALLRALSGITTPHLEREHRRRIERALDRLSTDR